MARQNYPFENMSVPDAEALFADARAAAPDPRRFEGEWDGHLISLKTPDTSLLNQVSPVLFHASFQSGQATCSAAGRAVRARLQCRANCVKLGPKTLLGKWTALDSPVAKALGDTIYFVLNRP